MFDDLTLAVSNSYMRHNERKNDPYQTFPQENYNAIKSNVFFHIKT